MEIQLIRASVEDAETIWKMQVRSFAELLNRYQDYETNPANEPIDKVINRLQQDSTYFYFIRYGEQFVGAIRVIDASNKNIRKRISPIFVLPEFRNHGVAAKAIVKAEEIHGSDNWELETILQERGNCHLYEKLGYRQTSKTQAINEKMTLIFYRKD